jgi:TonB family protein
MKLLYRFLLLCFVGQVSVFAQNLEQAIVTPYCEKPSYPSESARLNEEGTVQLKFSVGVDGRVIDSAVEKSSGFRRLDEAARQSLSKCTFKPGTKDGVAVESWASLKYTWKLNVFTPCVGSDIAKWKSCLGTLSTSIGGQSVVEYEAGKKSGRGIEYDATGNVIRAGIFEGENLVSERSLDTKLYPFNAQLIGNSANQTVNAAAVPANISTSNLPVCQGTNIAMWSNCFGTEAYPSGTKYVGEFINGKPHGQGTFFASNGTISGGIWADGKFLRSASEQQAISVNQTVAISTQQHNISQSNLPACRPLAFLHDCFGTFTTPSGERYVGEFRYSLYDGHGTLTYADGNKFVGWFKDGKYFGQGTLFASNGSVINQGIWVNGDFVRSSPVQQAVTPSAQTNSAERDRLTAEVEAERKKRQELEQQLVAAKEREAQLAFSVQPTPTQTNAPRRIAHALVIGNAAYPGSGRLDNPVNDANAISQKLRSMGFIVTTVTDANRQRLVQSMTQFRRSASSADISLLYYAGHGVQIFGTNYILPTDVDQTDPAQATIQGVSLNSVVENFLPGKTKLVFLDACRDNALQRTNDRSVLKGLAPISAAEGTLISYATKDGQTAADGVGSKNSPFTQALLEHLNDPQDIAVVLRKVRERVMKITGGKQQPWEYGSLTGGELVLSAIKLK